MSKKKIFVIGYFDHKNTGDEQYKLTFDYFLDKYLNIKPIYINCDMLLLHIFEESDIIILGGGDVLNDYFLDQLIIKFNRKSNKILAVSVGLPYVSILDTNKLDICDYIFERTRQKTYNSFYIQDMSRYIIKIPEGLKNVNSEITKLKNQSKKIISFSLNRHIFDKNNLKYYKKIINSFVKFVEYLLKLNYHIVFIPFNTNDKIEIENDILIHDDVYNMISDKSEITYITKEINSSEILEIYKNCFVNICMRYHSCLYSIYSGLPFLPIYTTKKIENLLLDTSWEHGIKLELNDDDIPMSLDIDELIIKFNELVKNDSRYKINKINDDIQNNTEGIFELINIIKTDYIKIKNVKNKKDLVNKRIDVLYNILQDFSKKYNIDDFRDIKGEYLQKIVINIISYNLTNTIDSKYNYGLTGKMFDKEFDYRKDFTWIIQDYIVTKKIYNNPIGLFNMNYIDQNDYSGAHRSGWQYVYQNLKCMNTNNVKIKNKVVPYLDLYVDRTFHWNKDINKILKIIPYKRDWIGFIHHTFDTTFSDYNNYNLLSNEDFLNSLKTCKGLFVLSKNLKDLFVIELNKLNIDVDIYVLMHPTEKPEVKFTMTSFLQNKDKKLINVGGWLRDIFSFYNLELPSIVRKVGLKGVNMDNYYPSKTFDQDLIKFLVDIESDSVDGALPKNSCPGNISQNSCRELKNNWYRYYNIHIKDIYDSVDIIEKLSNDEYDKLLSENIIFLNLVDASAVNTIIECKIRNTPVIVNRIPAVVEILGENYPFYYNNGSYYEINKQVENLLTIENIKKAYNYLKHLSKTDLDISDFIKKFTNILIAVK